MHVEMLTRSRWTTRIWDSLGLVFETCVIFNNSNEHNFNVTLRIKENDIVSVHACKRLYFRAFHGGKLKKLGILFCYRKKLIYIYFWESLRRQIEETWNFGLLQIYYVCVEFRLWPKRKSFVSFFKYISVRDFRENSINFVRYTRRKPVCWHRRLNLF